MLLWYIIDHSNIILTQLAECVLCKHKVEGSNLSISKYTCDFSSSNLVYKYKYFILVAGSNPVLPYDLCTRNLFDTKMTYNRGFMPRHFTAFLGAHTGCNMQSGNPLYVCMYVWSSHTLKMDQPGKAANPAARGQLNRKNEYFPVFFRA